MPQLVRRTAPARPSSAGRPPSAPSTLDVAVRLHELGYWVVPQVGKRAIALGWQQFRLSEVDLTEYLSGRHLNIAIALNQSAVIDVECDSDDAERELQALCGGAVPKTPTWRSRRGLHRLFLRPDPDLVPDKAKVEVNGIEFRLGGGGKGALSTVPPSIHPDDPSVVYQWLAGQSLFDCQPAELPEPVLALLKKARRSKRAGGAAVEYADDQKIPEGHRNDALFRLGCRAMRQWDADQVAAYLHGENKLRCDPPLDDAEIESILTSVRAIAERSKTDITSARCSAWAEVRAAWNDALEMRQSLEEVLAVMLAVATSTSQVGNQLFLQVVGEPGSAKTRLCDAMLVSPRCQRVERLTGLFSGTLDKDDPSKDYSFLARSNHTTWITPEMDLLMSTPQYAEIMSQVRRVFDGSTSASFKNREKDMVYNALRTPWIQAGTPAMIDRKQASLGDRFLRVYMDSPDADTKRRILRKVGYTELDAVMVESNCSAESTQPRKMMQAYRLTGGYVDWLRANATRELRALRQDNDALIDWCADRADFVAHMRSAPPDLQYGKEPDYHAVKELPSRLQAQFLRMALCLAVVLNKPGVDEEVLRIVRRVALDTATGRALTLTRHLARAGDTGLHRDDLASLSGEDKVKVGRWLVHMKKIHAVHGWKPDRGGGVKSGIVKWRMTPHLQRLYREVVGDE